MKQQKLVLHLENDEWVRCKICGNWGWSTYMIQLPDETWVCQFEKPRVEITPDMMKKIWFEENDQAPLQYCSNQDKKYPDIKYLIGEEAP